MDTPRLLEQLADDFASVVLAVDAEAEHDRWQAGIGPFEEERQIEMLREAVDGDTNHSIETEAPYLDGGQRVDLFIKSEDTAIPVEAKLLRFRYDNGNIDPNSFAKVFSPFPERTTGGRQRWITAHGERVTRDGDGSVVREYMQDITDRKERERRLSRERKQHATLFKTLPTPVLHARIEDGEPVVKTVNPAFEDTFGYDTETVKDQSITSTAA